MLTEPLPRRCAAELVGTLLLVLAVVGSGIAATRLSTDVGVQLLINAAATAGALLAVISALGAVSGAHLNPVVSLVDRARGGLSPREALAYAGAQVAGALLGVAAAHAIWSAPLHLGTRSRGGAAAFLSEVLATAGLVLVVVGVSRARSGASAPLAVAGYIGGAYFFTSSTSFANPAVTVACALTDTFTGIEPADAALFVLAQLVGAGVGAVAAHVIFGDDRTPVVVAPAEVTT